MKLLVFVSLAVFCRATPGIAQTLSDALDSPAMTWVTGGDLTWRPEPSGTGKAGDSLASSGPYGFPGPNDFAPEAAWMETGINGPGTFRIFVRSNGNPYLTASLAVDGVPMDHWSYQTETRVLLTPTLWKPLSVPLGSGYHTIRLTGAFGAKGFGEQQTNQPTLQADAASLIPPFTMAGDALEATGQEWWSGGDPGFIPVNDVTHDGVDALSAPAQVGSAWLETKVTGPATVSWWRKGAAQVSVGGLSFSTVLWEDWTWEKAFVPAGDQVIRWTRSGTNAQGLWLDGFTVMPGVPASLAQALDNPSLSFISNNWQAHSSSAAPDGEDLAWADVTTSTDAWLETVIPGPALVEFKVCVRGIRPRLEVLADGVSLVTNGGSYGDDWDDQSILLGEGNHIVRWQSQRDGLIPPRRALLMLDQLRVTATAVNTIQQAADDENLNWTSPGAVPWLATVSTVAHDGIDTTFSPPLSAGQTAVLETTVTGPGTFSFWSQSKIQGGPSRFSVNGFATQNKQAYSGPTPWQSQVVEVPSGIHTFRWEVSGPCGAGALLVDQVKWKPESPTPISSALDLPEMVFYASSRDITKDSAVHDDGVDSLKLDGTSSQYPDLTALWFWVTGPAILNFKTRSINGYLTATPEGGAGTTFSGTEWSSGSLLILPGRRQVLFTHDRLYTSGSAPSASWIDSLTVTSTAVSLGAGLSAPGFNWRTNPANPWVGVATPYLHASPGLLSSVDLSWLETDVAGPAVVEFKASSRLDLYLDGNLQSKLNYPSAQATSSLIFLQPGTHRLRWIPAENYYGQNPALASFSVATMSGLPSLKFENREWIYHVPRPEGFTDERIVLEATTPPHDLYFTRIFNPSVANSTPQVLRYRISAPDGSGARQFLRTRFMPKNF